jgi:hypothetical protein
LYRDWRWSGREELVAEVEAERSKVAEAEARLRKATDKVFHPSFPPYGGFKLMTGWALGSSSC